ncbi:hypothetical protein BD410DRAFT_802358 [Rickenella mellea]|uniref:F-box domain-containing protein n=1 Tax=Rickenella mellea TaxID=50990 RepID=A0A4Y7Q9M1_9AGAM|nr:hypothetical protein BD410DRAFT_802358 [Rickenella mellea]
MIHKNRCYDQATADKATPAPIWHMASTPNSCQTGAGVAVQIFSSFALRVPAHLSCERPLQSYGVAGFVVSICIQVVKARVLPLTRESYRGLVKREQRNMVEIAPSANPLIFFAWNLEFTLLFSVRSFTRFCLSVNTTDRILPRSPLSSSPKYHEYLLASLVSLFVMGNIVSTTQYQCAPFSPASLTTSVSKPRGSGRPQGIDSSPASPQEDHGDGHVVTGMKRKADVTLAERPAKRGLTLSSFAQRMTTNLDACLCRTKHSRRKNMAFAQRNRTTTPLYHCPTEVLQGFATPMELRDLRALTQVSPYFAEVYKQHYFHAVGFIATPRNDQLTIDLKTTTPTSSYEGLLVWRRSRSFRKINHLKIRLSHSVDVATYEARILRCFFHSLSQLVPSTHVERLSIVVLGPERYQLIRLLAAIRNGGVRHLSIRTHTLAQCNPPMALTAIRGTLSDLESIDLQLDPSFSPIREWSISSIVSSFSTLRILSVTTMLTGSRWRQLFLCDDLVFPSLEEVKFDVTISFKALMCFLRRHPLLKDIAVVNVADEFGHIMNLQDGGGVAHLPNLWRLDGPAAFVVSMLNNILKPLPWLCHISIRHDGFILGSVALEKVLQLLPRSVTNLEVEFGKHMDRAMFADMGNNRIERRLDHITTLMVSQTGVAPLMVPQTGGDDGDIMDYISRWAGLFPAVTRIVAFSEYSKRSVFKEKLLAACASLSDDAITVY